MEQKPKSTKIINQNEIHHGATEPLSCPPLETLPNKNNPVDCFCERKPKFLIPRRGLKRAAFTLAEVLITLAIIGVVAALTIPSVIQNYTYRMTESKLAKFYSLMNQAILMSKIDNGHQRPGITGLMRSKMKKEMLLIRVMP